MEYFSSPTLWRGPPLISVNLHQNPLISVNFRPDLWKFRRQFPLKFPLQTGHKKVSIIRLNGDRGLSECLKNYSRICPEQKAGILPAYRKSGFQTNLVMFSCQVILACQFRVFLKVEV